MAYPFDNQTWNGEPLVMDTEDAGIAGSPDGMTIDAEDRFGWRCAMEDWSYASIRLPGVYRKIEFPMWKRCCARVPSSTDCS